MPDETNSSAEEPTMTEGLEPRVVALDNVCLLQLVVPPNGPEARVVGQVALPHAMAREVGCALITAATVALSSVEVAQALAIAQAQAEANEIKLKS